MSKPNHLFDHLSDDGFRDPKSRILVTPDPGRLTFSYGKRPGDWRTVADLIAGPRRLAVTWFPDANIAFTPAAEIVWGALRFAGLGIPGGVACLSAVVLGEMEEWLDDPYRLKERARDIKSAIQCGTWLRRLSFAPDSPLAPAIYGYAHLLGIRRLLTQPLASGLTLLGHPASDKARAMNAIRERLGPRAVGLARKGRLDAQKNGMVNVSDELHCLMVVVNALLRGVDSAILTADEDFLEIFYKVQWFLDTHYRAWLATPLVRDGRYGRPAGELADTQGCFDGPLILYRRTTSHLQEVLPARYQCVRVGVLYVTPAGQIQAMNFSFERGMLDMLRVRAATGGRCTDLFDGANLHVDLGPLKVGQSGLYLGVGRDVGMTVETRVGRSFLAKMDQEHAVTSFERFVRP